MKRAILYIRVSTDEQADKGFSLLSQEEQLRKYCASNAITIIHLFREDHSAKTFERPEFKTMLQFCKQNRKEIDLLLFVKWDRFSRNTRDSYQMIHQFQKLGIEACATEQPLDLNVPESKIMLAIYLASPEVENDRRALNVFNGMRKAKKEGRYVGSAPMGYSNSRDERNRPIIKPNESAPFIKHAFDEMATGAYSQEEIRRRLSSNGFKCSRNSFNKILKNPAYAGNIYLPAFKDEPASVIKGNHEPIISEELYDKVQDIINHRKPTNTIKKSDRDEFPLRGLLICCKCGRLLTGSSGLSKTGRHYFYYHCTKGCKEIYPIEKVHRAFLTVLQSIVSRSEWIHLYQEALRVILVENKGDSREQLLKLQSEIDKNKARVTKAMQMMLDGQLDSADYKTIKEQYETANASIMKECAILSSQKDYTTTIAGGFGLLSNMTDIFQRADTETKKRIVSLNFPGRLIFQNEKVQTPKISDVLSLIMLNDSKLQGIKKGQTLKKSHLSLMVHS